MAETQANKLRARTRDALGPKVRGGVGQHPAVCVGVVGRWVVQLIPPPLPLAQGVMPEALGSEEGCLLFAPHLPSAEAAPPDPVVSSSPSAEPQQSQALLHPE